MEVVYSSMLSESTSVWYSVLVDIGYTGILLILVVSLVFLMFVRMTVLSLLC